MRILFIITKSTEGGAQTHITQLAKALLRRGDSVGVMSAPGGWLEEEIVKNGGTFFPCQQFKNTYNPLRLIRALLAVQMVVRSFAPDIVSCHSAIGGLVGRAAIRNRIPTLFTAHGWTFSAGASPIRRALSLVVEMVAARWSQKIICVSEFDRRLALRYRIAPEQKVVAIHNGTEIPFSIPMIKKGLRQIIFVGRLVSPKRPIVLLKALCLVHPQIVSQINVLFVGGGRQQQSLEKFASQHSLTNTVRFLGSAPRKKVLSLIQESNLLVLPSKHEGLPRSIIEALSYGVPVIASSVGGINELIQDSVGYTLNPKHEVEELARYVETLFRTPDLLSEMSEHAYYRAKNFFSIEKTIEKTIEVYDEVLSA